MRTWTITHPDLGTVEVIEGYEIEVKALDPGWPGDDKEPVGQDDSNDLDGHGGDEATPAGDDDPGEELAKQRQSMLDDSSRVALKLKGRAELLEKAGRRIRFMSAWCEKTASRCRENVAMFCLVRCDGKVYARFGAIEKSRSVDLDKPLEDGHVTTSNFAVDKPRVLMDANANGELVNVVLIAEDGKGLFDPPPGSYAAERYSAMEESPWKRFLFPVLTGLGKVSGALAGIILAPVFAAIVAWIGQFIPDITWPTIPWPHINFPEIPWPDINFPDIPWPDINLPSLPEPPPWVDWLMEHTKLWVPLVVGLFLGVGAFRTARKSKKSRKKWGETGGSGREDDARGELPSEGPDERLGD